jgi:hypothetical protein
MNCYMYLEWYYNFALCTPIIPLALLIFFNNSSPKQSHKILILLFSTDLITNVLTAYFEAKYGNVYPITNLSLVIQAFLILQFIKGLERSNKTIVNMSIIFILLLFFCESILRSNFWADNKFTLISCHVIIILIGWIAIYQSYKNTTELEFRFLAINILYNTVFFIEILFMDKIHFSKELFLYTFPFTVNLYIGANLFYAFTIWSLRKNLD